MKIILTIIPTSLVAKLLLFLFCPVLEIKNQESRKQESRFNQVGGLVTRNVYVLFIASSALLQSHTEFNRLL